VRGKSASDGNRPLGVPVSVFARVYVGDFARGEYVGDFARGGLVGVFARCVFVDVFGRSADARGLSDGDFAREPVGVFARPPFVGVFARGEFVGDFARGEFVGDVARGEFVGDVARGEFVGDFGRGEIVTGLPGEPVEDFARPAPLSTRISRTVSSSPRRPTSTSARRVPMRTSTGSSVLVSAAIIVPMGVPRVTDVSCSIVRGRAVRLVNPVALRIAIGRPTSSTTSVTPSRSRYPRSWSSWPTVL
jgi:hypothetical protein